MFAVLVSCPIYTYYSNFMFSAIASHRASLTEHRRQTTDDSSSYELGFCFTGLILGSSFSKEFRNNRQN